MSTPQAADKSAQIIHRVYARSTRRAPENGVGVTLPADRTNGTDGAISVDLAGSAEATEQQALPETIDAGIANSEDAPMGEARLLRILSGPHFGAEMSLRPGRYAIGTDENCDIVLSDSRLAPRHAFLILSDEQVSIEPGDGAVTVGGAAIDGRVAVDDFTPVLIGTTMLALGPANATWPEIPLEKPAPDPPEPADDTQSASADAAALPAAAVPAVADPTPAAVAEAPPAATEEADRRDWRRWGRWAALAAAAVVLLVAAGFGLHAWDAGRDPTPAADAPTSRAQVEKIVDELDFGSALEVSEGAGASDGRVEVQGYLDTEQQRRELLAALQPMQGQLDVRVWSTALMDESIRQVLSGLRLQLDVSETKQGKVVLAGVLPNTVSEDDLRAALQRDVPGITSIDLEVVSSAAAMRWLRDRIAGIGVAHEALKVSQEGHSFVVNGELETGLESKWHDLVQTFERRYGAQLALQDDVSFGSIGQGPTFDFNIRAINLGPPPYMTLDSGAKYLVGSRLDNGMILEQIMANGMVLRDGDTRHLVEIAQDSGRITNVRQLESE